MVEFVPSTSFNLAVTVSIRKLVQSDLRKLEWYGQYRHYRLMFRRAYQEQRSGKRILLVADLRDFPVGRIFLLLESSHTQIADGKHNGYMYGFRVMDMLQGSGIGTRLIQTAEDILAQMNYRRVTLSVAKTNRDAIRLYERLNYAICGEDRGEWQYKNHKGEIVQEAEPCWILEKLLSTR